jgi:hypothetical protein
MGEGVPPSRTPSDIDVIGGSFTMNYEVTHHGQGLGAPEGGYTQHL